MNILVVIKLVPDLVEELSIDSSGTALDTAWLRLIINEFDDHALEQALLLKEAGGGQVTVIAPDVEGADDVLFTAAAKGAGQLIKLAGDFEAGVNNHGLARVLAEVARPLQPDLVLTGVQAHNDLDGPLGVLLAECLGMAYVGYVAGVTAEAGQVVARKEYPGGLSAEIAVPLPAVLGIQAAAQAPRYVAVSKVNQAMKTASIQPHPAPAWDSTGGLPVGRIFQPEAAARAEMLEGDPESVAARLAEIIKETAGL